MTIRYLSVTAAVLASLLFAPLWVVAGGVSDRNTSPAEQRTTTEAEQRTTTEAQERDTGDALQRRSDGAEERDTGEVYERDEERDVDDDVDAREIPPARRGTPQGGEQRGAPTPPQ